MTKRAEITIVPTADYISGIPAIAYTGPPSMIVKSNDGLQSYTLAGCSSSRRPRSSWANQMRAELPLRRPPTIRCLPPSGRRDRPCRLSSGPVEPEG